MYASDFCANYLVPWQKKSKKTECNPCERAKPLNLLMILPNHFAANTKLRMSAFAIWADKVPASTPKVTPDVRTSSIRRTRIEEPVNLVLVRFAGTVTLNAVSWSAFLCPEDLIDCLRSRHNTGGMIRMTGFRCCAANSMANSVAK